MACCPSAKRHPHAPCASAIPGLEDGRAGALLAGEGQAWAAGAVPSHAVQPRKLNLRTLGNCLGVHSCFKLQDTVYFTLP